MADEPILESLKSLRIARRRVQNLANSGDPDFIAQKMAIVHLFTHVEGELALIQAMSLADAKAERCLANSGWAGELSLAELETLPDMTDEVPLCNSMSCDLPAVVGG